MLLRCQISTRIRSAPSHGLQQSSRRASLTDGLIDITLQCTNFNVSESAPGHEQTNRPRQSRVCFGSVNRLQSGEIPSENADCQNRLFSMKKLAISSQFL
jgi:hypothetical protein